MPDWFADCRWLARRAARASWAARRLGLEAFVGLGVARLAVVVLPFRWLSPVLGVWRRETPFAGDAASAATARHIGSMVGRLSGRTAWKSNCLAQAIAAHMMLRRRAIASTLYIGVLDGPEFPLSHAWVRCGGDVITGRVEERRCRSVASYANEG
jgi:hypothetical protein